MLPRLAPRPLPSSRVDEASARAAALCWGGGAVVCLLLGGIVLAAAPLGALTRHMATHLLLMNAVAPLVALATMATRHPMPDLAATRSLVGATVIQFVLLWAWHAPAVLAVAVPVPAVDAVMQVSFLAAALWFWLEVCPTAASFAGARCSPCC